MEEKLKIKMQQQYNSYTKKNKELVLLLSIVFIPVLTIVGITLGVQSQGWSAIPSLLIKLAIICFIGIFCFYKAITMPYRRLNRKRYHFFEARVMKKRYEKRHMEFVEDDNKRYFGEMHYLLLDNDEFYTVAEAWPFHDVRENERYLFASIGSKKRRKCVIVGALKLD